MNLLWQQHIFPGQTCQLSIKFTKFEINQKDLLAATFDVQNMLCALELISRLGFDHFTVGTFDNRTPGRGHIYLLNLFLIIGHSSPSIRAPLNTAKGC